MMNTHGSDPFEDSPPPVESGEVPSGYDADPADSYYSQGSASSKFPLLLVVLGAILLISAVALFFFIRGGSEDSTSSENARSAATVPSTTVIDAPVLNGMDSGEAASEESATTDSSSSTSYPSRSPLESRLPEDELPGGDLSVVTRGTAVTSEPFALAVAEEYREFRDKTGELAGTIRAYSEVTSMTYTMSCAPDGADVVCHGGDNAVVIISGR